MTTPNTDQYLVPATVPEQMLTELGLAAHDVPRIREAAKALQDIAPGNLHHYGRETTGKANAFSTQLLDQVRNADLDSSGDKLGEVVRIARSLNLDSIAGRSKVPILGPLIDKLRASKDQLVQVYSGTNKQIDQLMVDVGKTQAVQQQRVREYDQMHGIVVEERRELGVHVAAGRLRLEELEHEHSTLLDRNDPESRTRRADLDTALRLIDKRVSDLQVLQHATEQTLPMIRLIQANAIQLIEKFSAVRDVTIPLWRNQFAIQLSLADQRNAVELANAVDDATNELLRRNAELVHSTATGAARANQRSVIDVETLRSVNDTLIRTIEEVREIHREGMVKRKQLGAELLGMRTELEKQLSLPTAAGATTA